MPAGARRDPLSGRCGWRWRNIIGSAHAQSRPPWGHRSPPRGTTGPRDPLDYSVLRAAAPPRRRSFHSYHTLFHTYFCRWSDRRAWCQGATQIMTGTSLRGSSSHCSARKKWIGLLLCLTFFTNAISVMNAWNWVYVSWTQKREKNFMPQGNIASLAVLSPTNIQNSAALIWTDLFYPFSPKLTF